MLQLNAFVLPLRAFVLQLVQADAGGAGFPIKLDPPVRRDARVLVLPMTLPVGPQHQPALPAHLGCMPLCIWARRVPKTPLHHTSLTI